MTLIVQDDSGTVAGANGYVTVAEFKSYHDARGNAYGSATDSAIGIAIIKATDYLDTRFNFKGTRSHQGSSQPTQWPRLNVVNSDGFWVSGIPDEVKKACCEYALRALSASLMSDPVSIDDSGRSVKRISKKAGPVSKDVEYSDSTAYQLPTYPAADRILFTSGLLQSSNQLARA